MRTSQMALLISTANILDIREHPLLYTDLDEGGQNGRNQLN